MLCFTLQAKYLLSNQELYELAQRKFQRQINGFSSENLPYPRLYVVDIIGDSQSDNSQEADPVSYEIICQINGFSSENMPYPRLYVVDIMRDSQSDNSQEADPVSYEMIDNNKPNAKCTG